MSGWVKRVQLSRLSWRWLSPKRRANKTYIKIKPFRCSALIRYKEK